MNIEITQAPDGDAPLDIREGWVGIKLPTIDHRERSIRTVGILSSPKNIWSYLYLFFTSKTSRTNGYIVNSGKAIELLKMHNPNAAKWWCENTSYENSGRVFLFQTESCRELSNES